MLQQREHEPLQRDPMIPGKPSLPSRLNKWRKTFAGELVEVALVALLLFLGVRLAVQNFKVQGHSMMPTLHNNEFVLVDKLSYDFISPHRGDIIVFRDPLNPAEDFIKRIIAVPGDRVTIHNSGVYVNGRRLYERYTIHPYARSYPMTAIPYTNSPLVPPNSYFVLGDNRSRSDDSHLWGLLPRKDIIGRAIVAYWPLQRFGLLTDPSTRSGKSGKERT
jgi:signal peptidase I